MMRRQFCLAAADPPFPGARWREATPESQGVNAAELRAAVAYFDANFGPQGAREMVIVRNGRLIWKGPDCANYHNVWSCTKTFTSTVLGLMIADGTCALDDPAVKYWPELDDRFPAYAKISLRHLASMSSGYQGEVAGKSKEQPWGEPVHYLNPREPLFEAGAGVQYHDHQVFVLGAILTKLAGESLKAVFARRVAGPLGMARWDWGVSFRRDGAGHNNAAGTPETPGIQITALDMARFGLLYLNRGRWNRKQLLPASFVDEATRNQAPPAGASRFLQSRYGFYWWTNGVRPDGKRPWPAAPPRAYTSHGRGSNFCFVIPEWDMVVARLGTIPFGSPTATPSPQDTVWDGFLGRTGEGIRG